MGGGGTVPLLSPRCLHSDAAAVTPRQPCEVKGSACCRSPPREILHPNRVVVHVVAAVEPDPRWRRCGASEGDGRLRPVAVQRQRLAAVGGVAAAAQLQVWRRAQVRCHSRLHEQQEQRWRHRPWAYTPAGPNNNLTYRKVTNWASKIFGIILAKSKSVYIFQFFRPKPAVLGVLAGSAGQ